MSARIEVIRMIHQATNDLHGRSPDRVAVSPDLYARLIAELMEMESYRERGLLAAPIDVSNVLVAGVPVVCCRVA